MTGRAGVGSVVPLSPGPVLFPLNHRLRYESFPQTWVPLWRDSLALHVLSHIRCPDKLLSPPSESQRDRGSLGSVGGSSAWRAEPLRGGKFWALQEGQGLTRQDPPLPPHPHDLKGPESRRVAAGSSACVICLLSPGNVYPEWWRLHLCRASGVWRTCLGGSLFCSPSPRSSVFSVSLP